MPQSTHIMDEAARLVAELQRKLSQLDHKVWQYRRDMAAEYDKYTEDLLRGVPKDVVETVSKTLALSIDDYKSLYPRPASSIESCTTGTSILPNGPDNDDRPAQPHPHPPPPSHPSPIPTPLQHHEPDADGSPRSPHEREKEFQGVFTPSYLPLLDSTNRHERRSSLPLPQMEMKDKLCEDGPVHVDASTDTRSLANTPEPGRPQPPTLQRRNTDEASILSDGSEGPIRRSALRRSSSASNKAESPRRVRFEVDGEEVLPTSSPVPRGSMLPENADGLGDDSDDEGGSTQIEDVDDAPPPQRISSSQALRNLSRSPLADDGTQWTTVIAPADGSASVVADKNVSWNPSSSEDLHSGNAIQPRGSEQTSSKADTANRGSAGPGLSEAGMGELTAEHDTSHDTDEASEDEMLDMPPLRRQSASTASMLSPSVPPSFEDNKSPTASTRPSRDLSQSIESLKSNGSDANDGDLKFSEDDEDDLFHFDENTEHRGTRYQEDEDVEQSDNESDLSPTTIKQPVSQHSTPLTRDIIVPARSHPPSSGTIGSYNGHPFSLPIVSPEIHAQAASLGNIDSFVGSVDGRSGLDASNPQSFRRSGVGSFTGAPKSMTERMLLDDIMEAEENRKQKTGK